MIILVEPQCRGYEHEQFNAGFLYGYMLAYPHEKIVFFAEKEHIRCVKNVLDSAEISVAQVECRELNIPESRQLGKAGVIFVYYRLLEEILRYASDAHCNKLSFFSVYAYNLIPLKVLLRRKYQRQFDIHVAMHGTIDFVRQSNFSFPMLEYGLILYRFLARRILGKDVDIKIEPNNKYLFEKTFKGSLYFLGNHGITYYLLREGTLEHIKKYLSADLCAHFRSIELPCVYKPLKIDPNIPVGKRIFSTIGRGDVKAVRRLVQSLLVNGVSQDAFEIRVLGSGARRPDDPAVIKFIGGGRALERVEIEGQMMDVHYALFFYTPDAYELTASGAFFDSISYQKPMIFLKNICFDHYFQQYKFGYRCEDMDALVKIVQDKIMDGNKGYFYHCAEVGRMRRSISVEKNFYKLRFEEVHD